MVWCLIVYDRESRRARAVTARRKSVQQKTSPDPSEKRSSIPDSPILKLNRVNIERETESEKACKRAEKAWRGNGEDRGCGQEW